MNKGYSCSVYKQEVEEYLKKYPSTYTILDVGAGCGTYYNLLSNHFPIIDAVEVFSPNIEEFDLTNKYRHVFNEDIRNFKFDYYDIIIYGDVIEHLSVEDAQKIINYSYNKCDVMLIAVPFLLEQETIYDNKYEIHLQPDLTPQLFNQRYPGFKVLYQTEYCGYYIKEKTKIEWMKNMILNLM